MYQLGDHTSGACELDDILGVASTGSYLSRTVLESDGRVRQRLANWLW
jgi:hypothetical protein